MTRIEFLSSRELAVENGSSRTAPTANHPYGIFSAGGRD